MTLQHPERSQWRPNFGTLRDGTGSHIPGNPPVNQGRQQHLNTVVRRGLRGGNGYAYPPLQGRRSLIKRVTALRGRGASAAQMSSYYSWRQEGAAGTLLDAILHHTMPPP